MATDVAEERGRSGHLGADRGLGTSELPSQAGAAEKMEVDTRADARCVTLGRVFGLWLWFWLVPWSLVLALVSSLPECVLLRPRLYVSRVCVALAPFCGST